MKILNQLLTVTLEDRNAFQIIVWWELRRVLYNFILLICGLTSMSALVNLKPGEDLQEPVLIIGFAFLCNLGYTIGWLSEIFKIKSPTYGSKMLKVGLYFTLFWIFLPAVLHILFWIGRGFERMN